MIAATMTAPVKAAPTMSSMPRVRRKRRSLSNRRRLFSWKNCSQSSTRLVGAVTGLKSTVEG